MVTGTSWSELKARDNNVIVAGRQSVSPLISSIIGGRELVQSFQNSQYRAGSVSSCGLVALNFCLIAFRNGADGTGVLLESLLGSSAAETTDEILKVSDMWSGSAHLEVDNLLQLPLFASLRLLTTQYAAVQVDEIVTLLRKLEDREGFTAAIITRPPEIIACLKVPLYDMDSGSSSSSPRSMTPSNMFIIFDSHPRPSHPDGAGWLFNTSLNATAQHIYSLIGVDQTIFDDPDMQWQAQLLNQFSGHIIAPLEGQKHSESDNTYIQQLVWDTSCRILTLQAELTQAKDHSGTLERINKKYEEEHDELRSSRRAAYDRIKDLEFANDSLSRKLESMNHHRSHSEVPRSSSKTYSAAVSKHHQPASSNDRSAGHSHHPRAAKPSRSAQDTGNNTRSDTKGKGREHPSSSTSADKFPHFTQREIQEQHDYMTAFQQQREYEDETRRLEQQRLALAASAQVTFTCGICLELVLEEDLALINSCQHRFCRECLRDYVLSKVQDRRFPIVCPICMSDKAHSEPGIVEHSLIEQMHIPSKDYEILEEMMLSQHCIPVHCAKCSRTAFVDRKEYQEHTIVACPLPRCTHAWCKNCMQDIEFGGPQHSCDGSNELASLMREKGWKCCPGCKTNFLKTDGCNHMTCLSPGCNMHFCYRCGQGIIQSALRSEIQTAISGHYRVCHLIEEVPDRGVPP